MKKIIATFEIICTKEKVKDFEDMAKDISNQEFDEEGILSADVQYTVEEV